MLFSLTSENNKLFLNARTIFFSSSYIRIHKYFSHLREQQTFFLLKQEKDLRGYRYEI